MNSFVGGNIRESNIKKQITENQLNNSENTTDFKTATKTNQIKLDITTPTLSNNDYNVNIKLETKNFSTQTLRENKRKKNENNTLTTAALAAASSEERNNVIENDKNKVSEDTVEGKKLVVSQISARPVIAAQEEETQQNFKQQVLFSAFNQRKENSINNDENSSLLSTKEINTPSLTIKATETSPFPPLAPDLTSSLSSCIMQHVFSDPTLCVNLRNRNLENQQRVSSNNQSYKKSTSSGHACDWRADTSAPNLRSVVKSGTVSASASPSMVRKSPDSTVLLPRRVSFPKSDNELVTGYLEPANPWEQAFMVKSISEIAELYMISCQKHNTTPLQPILDHLKAVDLTKQLRRHPLLSLKSIKLAPSDCEALEEVLKRVQYKSIDLSDCKLDETAASALFDMIEYYEATNELDISSNALGMTHRGWTSCIYMISHSRELQVLNAEGNPISKLSADHLGNALCTSNLHTLKLEHCGLKGAPLSGLCFKLWQNKVLKELWLAYNDLDCNDADTISEMLKCNHYLELIDISNNNIRDEGFRHIVKALIMQSKELERRTTFQRTAAIDDDGDFVSPVDSSPFVDLAIKQEDTLLNWNTKEQEMNETQPLKAISKCSDVAGRLNLYKDSSDLQSIAEKGKEIEMETFNDFVVECEQHKIKPPLISSVGSTIDENDGDEDTDNTVRSITVRNPLQSSSGGQSMLDKLLSMNSESSSEDGASNISTDTLAACNSEDASLVSDEIFESSSTTFTSSTTNPKAATNTGLEVTSMNEVAESSITLYPTAICTSSSQIHIGKEELAINKSSPLECTFLERKKLESDDINEALLSFPSNLEKSSNNQSSNVINNSNNNNNNTATKKNMPFTATQIASVPALSNNTEDQNFSRSRMYEVTAEDSNYLLSGTVTRIPDDLEINSQDQTNSILNHGANKALDVNKNTKLVEDFDDTHSTDSAFESASEGDISRHLPEEFTRLSTSLESSRFDEIAKELVIETATIASESNECLIVAAAQVTPSSTPTPPTPSFSNLSTPLTDRERLSVESSINSCLSSSLPSALHPALEETKKSLATTASEVRDKMPKVTIAQDSLTQKYKANSTACTSQSPIPTPPPPSTSPGGASSGLRRTESSCSFLTQSSRNRSQSTDSLSSENSLDGSVGSAESNFSASSHLNDKVTKNDTLTRQQRFTEAAVEFGTRTPGGLKALAVWNNNLSKESGYYLSDLLSETVSLELVNIGKNCLSNAFVNSIKESLMKNSTLTTLGLQSAHLSAIGIETLSSILTFGGNSTLQRIDIRDNKLEVASLEKLAEVLKSNTTITQIDIDDEPKRLSVGSEAHVDYARILENVRSMCSRNEKAQAQIVQDKSATNVVDKKRGYYLGSRKISLTCQSRPLVDSSKNVTSAANSKLDIKRKAGTRLRSPVPSPTAISPSSSPNRASRFQVFRVPEASPLTSPSTQNSIGSNLALTKVVSISTAALPFTSACEQIDQIHPNITSTSLPTSCSLPLMATISSSTQSIKRLSVSPRSRFLVRKVYEDPNLPLAGRFSQSITPPMNPPPTPISQKFQSHLDSSPYKQINTTFDDVLPDLISKSYKIAETLTREITNANILVTLPSIVTPQQQHNTTTDNASTPNLKVVTEKSIPTVATIITKPSEQSTNNTLKNENITDLAQKTISTQIVVSSSLVTLPTNSTNLQISPSIPYTLSALPSSSESSSLSSSSSSSSTSPASNTDNSDSSTSSASAVLCHEVPNRQQQNDLRVSGQCPIAVFGDNDMTLTKNTVNDVLGAVAVAAKENENVLAQSAALQPESHQRVRKISWISNPTAVDKLLTLFHNSTTIFQRSSSPETKLVATLSTTTADIQLSQSPPTYAEAAAAAVTQQPKSQTSLVRKPLAPSWTKLSNDILTPGTTTSVDLPNTTAAASVVTEQSRSFFDAASKQFRDLSKQVFRQNLSFGNEPVTIAPATSNSRINTVSALNIYSLASENEGRRAEYCICGCAGTTNECLCGNNLTLECNADCLPTEVKQEIKENISPEHTLNDETLHILQKLHDNSSSVISVITPTTDLASNDDNNDWINIKACSTFKNNISLVVAADTNIPTKKSPTTQIQHTTITEPSGIESELEAHNE